MLAAALVEPAPVVYPRGRMRVVHVMASGERGGGLDHLKGLVPELERHGVRCSVVIGPEGPGGELLRAVGIPVTYVDLMRARVDPKAAVELWRVLRAARAEVLHYHGTRAAFFGCLVRGALGPAGPPSVYTAHGLSLRKPGAQAPIYAGVEALICRGVDHVVTVSAADLEELRQRGHLPPGRGTHLPNAVDAARFAPGPPGAGRGGAATERWIGTVARLVPQKAIADLLAALPLLEPSVRARIVGDGPLRGALEAQARDLGVADRTTFLGERDDVAELLRGLDVFVLPSHWEGEPIALLEAMATGLPCVATATSGARELFGEAGDVGVLVPVGDPAALAAAIRSLCDDPERRAMLGRAARARVAGRSWAASAEAHRQIYARVLGR